jgi:hypothetical protein
MISSFSLPDSMMPSQILLPLSQKIPKSQARQDKNGQNGKMAEITLFSMPHALCPFFLFALPPFPRI